MGTLRTNSPAGFFKCQRCKKTVSREGMITDKRNRPLRCKSCQTIVLKNKQSRKILKHTCNVNNLSEHGFHEFKRQTKLDQLQSDNRLANLFICAPKKI